MANYDFVVNSHFTPFTLQEMLTPFAAYKEEYDKTEAAYDKLAEADNFKYLSQTLPKGSRARDIYEGYANDLEEQAKDFAQNGLTMSNKGALTSLKRRYRGEIGRLIKADEALKEEKKLRQTLNAQDSSRLYATDNLNIDSFLDGENPNLYSISGNELYTKGAAAAKAAASRIYNVNGEAKTLGGYYLDFAQSVGYNADMMKAFTENIANIPELAAQVDNILMERGVYKNLTGENLKRARQSVINGMIDGAVYSESHNPQRNLGVIDASTQAQIDLQKRGQDIELATHGLTYDDKTNTVNYDPTKDPAIQKALISKGDKEGKQNYAGYDKLAYVSGGGTGIKYVDEIPSKATKVNIETGGEEEGDAYKVTVGSGSNKLVLGTIDKNGNFTKGQKLDASTYEKYFGHGLSWYQWLDVYKPEYDDQNIKALLNDVLEIAKREGETGFQNYNYYLEPDKVGWTNNGGGFYRDPLSRIGGTVNSSMPGVAAVGYGE